LHSKTNPTSYFFEKKELHCPKIKIVHNFHITYSNEMNQSFLFREKYNLWRKKIWKKKFENLNFFWCLLSPILSLFGHNFCSQAPNRKKNIFPWSCSVFLSSKKVSKNHYINSDRRYVPEIPFVCQMDNDPLGVNKYA